jgi:Icc-related predicted phosphoesterase
MKILVVGDKESPYIWDHFDRERFKDVRLVISSGDLSAEYLSFLVTMLNVPLLYVPGNHDSAYLTQPPEGCVNIDGKIYIHNGLNILGLGGSRRYKSGPFQYNDFQMNWRIRKLRFALWRKKKLDIFVSHSPALGLGDGKDLCHRGFPGFNSLLDRYKPKYFIHGHQHLTYCIRDRVTSYNETTIINTEGYYIFEY